MDDWNWVVLSNHINLDEVRKYPYLRWSRKGLSMNKDITIEDTTTLHLPNATGKWILFMIQMKSCEIWPPSTISGSSKSLVTIDKVKEDIYHIYNRSDISYDPKITVSDILYLFLPNVIGEWNWFTLSVNITMDEVRKYPYLTWSKAGLSRNRGITIYDILNLDLPCSMDDWDWYSLSTKMNIRDIIQSISLPWNKRGMSFNRGITGRIIQMIDMERVDILQRDYISLYTNITKSMYDICILCA